MATEWDHEFLKESGVSMVNEARKHAALTRSKTLKETEIGSSSNENILTRSSPALLESSRNHSRFQASFRFSSRPECETETTPIVAAVRQNEREVEERGTNCCKTVFNSYKNSAMRVTNSAFIYIIQLLFASIPVSSVIMGIIFAENCPKLDFLPVFGAVVGIIGVLLMAVWMYISYSNRHGTPCSNRQKVAFGAMCQLVLIMTIVDAVFVFRLSPVFDPTSADYCNETFYKYAFYKEIATFAAIVLSSILYLPGTRHTLCCSNCPMPSPPNALFYHSI